MYRIPILQMGDTLLVTIQVDMQDQMALGLQDDLANKIATTSAMIGASAVTRPALTRPPGR